MTTIHEANEEARTMEQGTDRDLLARAAAVVREVEAGTATLVRPPGLTGFSGDKILALLARLGELCADENAAYLEVGVFQGLTFLSVASANPRLRCLGVDNFAQLDPDHTNKSIVEERKARLECHNATLIDKDYEAALSGLESQLEGRKVGLYMIDGPHDYRSQLMSILLALPHLHARAIIVIDDCNYLHVRQANRDFLETHRGWKLLCEAYTPCHPGNMTADQRSSAACGWWNGVNVLIADPDDRLPRALPAAPGARELLEREHTILAARLTDLIPEALALAGAVYRRAPRALVKQAHAFHRASKAHRGTHGDLFEAMNTHSGALPSFRIHT